MNLVEIAEDAQAVARVVTDVSKDLLAVGESEYALLSDELREQGYTLLDLSDELNLLGE